MSIARREAKWISDCVLCAGQASALLQRAAISTYWGSISA
jgi:hypothetical protein